MSAGILVLKPGQHDMQEPHDSDEMYYVITGDGYLKIGRTDHIVSEGKMFFVKKDTKHKFHGNTKELQVVYFFSSQ